MYTLLRNKCEGLAQDAVTFAQELVQTPSPSFQEDRIAERIEAQMTRAGFDKVVRDDFGNVLGILFGRESAPTVLLNCHMDTIDVPHDGPWADPPHSGAIKDRRLYGLGAADCKSGLAAQVFAGALLKRSLLPLRGNLIVAATVGEENGRSAGVHGLMSHTLPELQLKPDFAILGEPTGLGLYYGHDGWLQLEVRVMGSNPFHVDDAANAIFRDLDAHPRAGRGKPVEMVTVHPPSFTDADGVRRATIRLARRVGLSEDVGDILHQTHHSASLVARPMGGVALDVSICQENQQLYTGRTAVVRHITNAWSTDPFCPLMERARQSLAAAGCEVRPGKWQLGRLGMGTAGSVLLKDYSVPTIGYGPGREDVAHAAGEYVETGAIVQAVYGTAAMVHSLVGVPVCGWTSDDI